MKDILKIIAAGKRTEVAAARSLVPLGVLKSLAADVERKPVSLAASIVAKHSTGIIAEFKRRSPSRGEIAPQACVTDIVPGYERSGASGCSVLTDTRFFGGALADLGAARSVSTLPLLRKEFIIDEYQIYEARLWGADAVLLIASLLTPAEVGRFTDTAHALGLEVLLELHGSHETDRVCRDVDMIGVNNRDLTTFHTDIDCSAAMADALQVFDAVKIAESGIRTPADIDRLRQVGYNGFLIGEAFMKTADPASALKQFVNYEH